MAPKSLAAAIFSSPTQTPVSPVRGAASTPNPAQVSREEWLDYVYLRDNPRGPHLEWWYHAAGCRRWFKVHRDTLTHEVLGCAAPGERMEEGSG